MQSIKAIIPSGSTEITVNGLHQWDYGRKLEIHSDDLPAVIEVHFACSGMDMAVVRSCEAVDGVATVPIPDKCLEQTTPVVAWVFEIEETTGVTTKKINMPIEARPRPSASEDIPQEVSDKYTEAITAVNAAVASLKAGEVKVSNATNADNATNASHAASADNATNAGYATSAGHASSAGTATNAGYATSAGHASSAGTANTASELSVTEAHYDAIATNESIEAELAYGKAYHISAGVLGQDDTMRSTFFLYIANKGDNFNAEGTIVYSTATKAGAFIRAQYTNGSWRLHFYNSSETKIPANNITIREI